ncbi:adenylyltransferase/cytidyltransferase family protein [Sulfitobacter sp. F26204]|uniref:adenylyltransferase/cytidyltransferase family protein n=1 Tax=Sulfitobacter sp. F26204 TaxID=2996014 RepID=UPI00225E12BF|nr:adenylyltransferase/cytidyltransferase family protein [Sulfitobacter sp. F26204]MCX7559860.1 adenylyltransferase/cytidyltransferase family protein [Sulfitobacter sp. F26204]
MSWPLRKATAPRIMLTYGRFDLFHQDHIRFLRQVSAMGHELIVGCATDEHARRSGYPCQMSYAERRAILQSCRFVSRVIPETSFDQKRTDIVNYNVSALVMGKNQRGHFDGLQDVAQVLYLPRLAARKQGVTPRFSTRRIAIG